MIKKKTQTFNDGTVFIYDVTNAAEPGKKPVKKLKLKEKLRLDNRTVGVTRFYAAMQSKVKVAYLIRCPFRPDVSADDIAVLKDGFQYEIKQLQYPEDAPIPVMDLTLERVKSEYGYV